MSINATGDWPDAAECARVVSAWSRLIPPGQAWEVWRSTPDDQVMTWAEKPRGNNVPPLVLRTIRETRHPYVLRHAAYPTPFAVESVQAGEQFLIVCFALKYDWNTILADVTTPTV